MPTSTSRPAAETARASVLARARELGFDSAGIASPDAAAAAGLRFRRFLELGWHGEMDWLAAKADRRADPRALWPEARAIVMLGQSYAPAADPLAGLAAPEQGAVSVYAQGRDYHDVVKPRLKALGRWLAESYGTQVKVFVDTAPVLEKPLAQAAGLGWQGKHTNLVSRRHGSWLFLGAVFTTLPLAPDRAEADHCGGCRRCLDVCPTDAFPAPYRLDARRCISYLTIEHKGQIPREFRAAIGNRVYGCDDCLAVCPWNKFAEAAREIRLRPRPELTAPRLAALAGLDDAGFRRLFAGSAVKRLGRDRFVRNVVLAIGNSGRPELAAAARARLDDASPLVRGMAVWALKRLLPPADLVALRRAADPADAVTAEEWAA